MSEVCALRVLNVVVNSVDGASRATSGLEEIYSTADSIYCQLMTTMMVMTTTTTLSKAYEWMLVGTENIHELAAAIEV